MHDTVCTLLEVVNVADNALQQSPARQAAQCLHIACTMSRAEQNKQITANGGMCMYMSK